MILKRIPRPILWILLILPLALTAPNTVTLFDVNIQGLESSDPSIMTLSIDYTDKYSALNPSPGSDVTTYIVEKVRTKGVIIDLSATSTTTFLSTPTTLTFTRIEGASTKAFIDTNGKAELPPQTLDPVGVILQFVKSTQNCTYDTNEKQGVCLVEFEDSAAIPVTTTVNGVAITTTTVIETETVTITFSGALVPVATVVTGSSVMPRVIPGAWLWIVAAMGWWMA